MLDFLIISKKFTRSGGWEIKPKFITTASKDLMTRGGDFYAIWDETRGLWSTDEDTAIRLIDRALDDFVAENERSLGGGEIVVLHMWDSDSGSIDRWHKYVQKQRRDHYHSLDEKIIFASTVTVREDYASKRLPYDISEGPIDAYDELIGTLYSEEERKKIEWAIGSIFSGDSIKNQKFLVLYGSAGTGKSTVLNIMQDLFEGYFCTFDAKALGYASKDFALEPFRTNPLVAIQHDGDLSRIEDNTRLNSVVSHELMSVNEKYTKAYSNRFNCMLFMGTNKPVKITDAKSGLLRRLIDVSPSGEKVPLRRYKELVNNTKYELGAIAYHCKQVYESDRYAYDGYIPENMLSETNDFYNFVSEQYDKWVKTDFTVLAEAWELYRKYVEDSKFLHSLNKTEFGNELKNYFKEFYERKRVGDIRYRSYYEGFLKEKFEWEPKSTKKKKAEEEKLMTMKAKKSILDDILADCPAQYANEQDKPMLPWDKVTTKLRDLDTSRTHFVLVPENLIVIDFDLKDENGQKSFEKNLEAASKWPMTYAETSKSGQGIHLHYWYTGDVSKLSRMYSTDIEIKVFNGKSSLRRKVIKCNDTSVAEISSGLPLKGEKMVTLDEREVKNFRQLKALIVKTLKRQVGDGHTTPSMLFIQHILEEAQRNGVSYDIRSMRRDIEDFAFESSNQKEFCVDIALNLKYCSDDILEQENTEDYSDDRLVIFDCEVMKNLFVVCWKYLGDDHVVGMINPTPAEIAELLTKKLVGYNCRKYDNHILYGRVLGESNYELYCRSQLLVANNPDGYLAKAWGASFADIFDYSSKKQSLKKWEIELKRNHLELGIPWDQEVPEELWETVMEYCKNDVEATEAVFEATHGDYIAHEILAAFSGLTMNDTGNTMSARIMFGDNKQPWSEFNYRFMGDEHDDDYTLLEWDEWTRFTKDGKPVFPGYTFDQYAKKGEKSLYRGEYVGEGGYVYAEPGMYGNVITLDVTSMHPSSIIAEKLFGKYTEQFEKLVKARIAIKHKDFNKAIDILGEWSRPYLVDKSSAKSLSYALKIIINSVYGLTSAGFENPFRDLKSNMDNIVAKRGALFMVNLKHIVQEAGYKVVHIKTDSIKIANPDEAIINKVIAYGKLYGYNFEVEHVFDKICLVNDAVYIAKLSATDEEWMEADRDAHEMGLDSPTRWTATGTQFAVPYVFKTLFSHEPIIFDDVCEVKSVKGAIYLDFNESLDQHVDELKALGRDKRKAMREGNDILAKELEEREKELEASTHDYRFVGRVGQFTPIKAGHGGAELVSIDGDRVAAVTGTKGYRWFESEFVRKTYNGKMDIVDDTFYRALIDGAVDTISQYGDFEEFAS